MATFSHKGRRKKAGKHDGPFFREADTRRFSGHFHELSMRKYGNFRDGYAFFAVTLTDSADGGGVQWSVRNGSRPRNRTKAATACWSMR
jgi:hypothetical protein